MKGLIRAAICSTALLSLAANAVTIAQYRKIKAEGGDGWVTMRTYIVGIHDGLEASNTLLKSHNQHPLYCAPGNLTLKDDNLVEIIESSARKAVGQNGITEDNSPIDIALLFGLIATFPCNPSK